MDSGRRFPMRKIRGLFQVRSMLFITGVDVSVSQTEHKVMWKRVQNWTALKLAEHHARKSRIQLHRNEVCLRREQDRKYY